MRSEVSPAATQSASQAEPSDWIESLGSYTGVAEASGGAEALDLEADTLPHAPPARARPHRAKIVWIVSVAALALAGSIYLGVMNAGQDRTIAASTAPAPALPPQAQPVPQKSKPNAPPLPRVVDLLPLIDVSIDTASGVWTRSAGGAIDSDASTWAMLRIAYQPPEEYDLDVEFERLPGGAGGASTGLIGSARGTAFEWNAWLDPETCGFWLIDEKPWREGPAEARGTVAANAGGRHVARLSVRRDGVEGYLDGVRVAGWKTDFHDLTLPQAEQWGGAVSLGLRTYENPTRFFSVRLTQHTGMGRWLRK
jgi:hypothetical protein